MLIGQTGSTIIGAVKLQPLSLVLLFLAAACAQNAPSPSPEPSAFPPSGTQAESVGTTAPTEILQAATLTPTVKAADVDVDGCDETQGEILQTELVDPDLPRSLPYRVFIPPCASQFVGELPTLYLLHGLARTDAQWDELRADEIAEEYIASDQAPPFLIVMPWERLGLDFEQTIVEYLIPHMTEAYGADPDLRSIGGISRGAGWALRIGLQHPELFQAIGLHSPAVLVPDIYSIPDWLDAISRSVLPAIWIDIGERDPLRLSLPELTALFDAAEVPYLLNSNPGEHSESYWEANAEDYLRWYVSGWWDGELEKHPE